MYCFKLVLLNCWKNSAVQKWILAQNVEPIKIDAMKTESFVQSAVIENR